MGVFSIFSFRGQATTTPHASYHMKARVSTCSQPGEFPGRRSAGELVQKCHTCAPTDTVHETSRQLCHAHRKVQQWMKFCTRSSRQEGYRAVIIAVTEAQHVLSLSQTLFAKAGARSAGVVEWATFSCLETSKERNVLAAPSPIQAHKIQTHNAMWFCVCPSSYSLGHERLLTHPTHRLTTRSSWVKEVRNT
jgi:hypothetical protein